jgi:hypothetical protein
MANEEHLATLRKGTEAWNRWRDENHSVTPDLERADLAGTSLSTAISWFVTRNRFAEEPTLNLTQACLVHADITQAKLTRVDLSRANLTGANLFYTDLTDASLAGANLTGAELFRTNLTRANLAGTNLTEASLACTILADVKLEDADLTGCELDEATFARVDLTGCKGLGYCKHYGPSSVDLETLWLSSRLPLPFLRGVGLPDNLIDYLPSLLNQAIQFYSCFISYSSKDQAFAERLHADLQAKGVRCWFAPHDMRTGDKIRTRIDEVIRIHQKLLLILSADAVASGWVEKEVETAFEREQEAKDTVLFPIRLDATVMEQKAGWAADIKRSRHIGDFTRWKEHDAYQKALERLLRDLKVEAS